LLNNLKAQAATALIQSAINGTDLKDSLQQALISALVNTVGAKTANGIGNLRQSGALNAATHKIAHAIAGCALGAAQAGDKGGCAPGAIGALVGEMMAEATRQSPPMQAYLGTKDNQVYMASLFAGLAGALAGGDQEDIAIAGWAGSNAAANNGLAHQDEYDFAKKNRQLVAQKLGISEQEAEGRIVAEILRNSDEVYATGTGGIHDYEVRSLLGCQNLNCNGAQSDPNYADHEYNSQYIAANQDAYDAGLGELQTGMTYDQLVTANVENDPIGTAVAGGGLMGLGYLAGGTGTAVGMKIFGASLGAGLNYYFQNRRQSVDWTSVGLSGAAGFVTAGSTLAPSILTNVGASLFGSGVKRENPNAGMGAAGIGTMAGYAVGQGVTTYLNGRINLWSNPKEINVWLNGVTVGKFTKPSSIPGMAGNAGSSAVQELIGNESAILFEKVKKK